MPPSNEFDIFAQLDAELASVAKASDAKAKLAKTPKISSVNFAFLSPEKRAEMAEERQRLLAEMRSIEWRALANVAFFRREACACGKVHYSFLRMMQRITTTSGKPVTRWAVGADLTLTLPKEVIYEDAKIEMCHDCATSMGFDLLCGEVKYIAKPWERGAFQPRGNAAQIMPEEFDA